MCSHKIFQTSLSFLFVTLACFGPSHQLSLQKRNAAEFLGHDLDHRGEGSRFKRSPETYITGDFKIPIEQSAYPFVSHILSLQTTSGAHSCSGAILTPRFALTAAQCFENRSSPAAWRVVAGDRDLSKDEGTEQVRRIKRIHVHPEYSGPPQWRNDIALVELMEPLNFKAGIVAPIEWKDKYIDASSYLGEEAMALGWGKTESGTAASVLKQVEVPIISSYVCQRQYRKANISRNITSTMLCSGLRGSGQDMCQGDSGSPLIFETLLVGINSFGEGCSNAFAGVYTRVNAFTHWIESIMNSKKPEDRTSATATAVPSSTTPVFFNGTSTTSRPPRIWTREWSAKLFNETDYKGNLLILYGNICMNIQERAQQYLGSPSFNFFRCFLSPVGGDSQFNVTWSNIFRNFPQNQLGTNITFHTKSVDPGQSCVRLYTGKNCVGSNVVYESGSPCLSNISECGQSGLVQSVGPCGN